MATASKSRLHIVDSSAWLEYLANGPNAEQFAAVIEAVDRLVVPTVVITHWAALCGPRTMTFAISRTLNTDRTNGPPDRT